jgi:glycosyltransferase involved in cell wall biosynthesis
MPNSKPKISVITVVRNGAYFIERCLQSIADQDYDNVEYIVIDGASTDGTQAIIERYRNCIHYYQSQPDKGPYDAAMQGINMASGDIIGFLMADDWLSVKAISTLAKMYKEKPDADIFCFGMQEHKQLVSSDAPENYVMTRVFRDPAGSHFDLLGGLYCHGLNRFFSKRVMQSEVYARSELYPQLADRDFYVRLGLKKIEKSTTSDILYHVLVHEGANSTGGSSNKISRFLDETSRIAFEHMSNAELTAQERKILIDWYCFNKIRMVWFLVRSGKFFAALRTSIGLLLCYPVATIRNIIYWRMPKAYRPVRLL